MARAEHQF